MIFKFKADAEFEAENIDDALNKLSNHFKVIVKDENEENIIEYNELFLPDSYLELNPKKEE